MAMESSSNQGTPLARNVTQKTTLKMAHQRPLVYHVRNSYIVFLLRGGEKINVLHNHSL